MTAFRKGAITDAQQRDGIVRADANQVCAMVFKPACQIGWPNPKAGVCLFLAGQCERPLA